MRLAECIYRTHSTSAPRVTDPLLRVHRRRPERARASPCIPTYQLSTIRDSRVRVSRGRSGESDSSSKARRFSAAFAAVLAVYSGLPARAPPSDGGLGAGRRGRNHGGRAHGHASGAVAPFGLSGHARRLPDGRYSRHGRFPARGLHGEGLEANRDARRSIPGALVTSVVLAGALAAVFVHAPRTTRMLTPFGRNTRRSADHREFRATTGGVAALDGSGGRLAGRGRCCDRHGGDGPGVLTARIEGVSTGWRRRRRWAATSSDVHGGGPSPPAVCICSAGCATARFNGWDINTQAREQYCQSGPSVVIPVRGQSSSTQLGTAGIRQRRRRASDLGVGDGASTAAADLHGRQPGQAHWEHGNRSIDGGPAALSGEPPPVKSGTRHRCDLVNLLKAGRPA